MIAWILPAMLAVATPKVTKVTSLTVEPAPLVLAGAEGRRVLVTGITKNGERLDLTAAAVLKPLGDGVRLDKEGFLYAVKDGETRVAVTAGGAKTEVAVTATGVGKAREQTFLRDVMPVLNKVGCTAGTCHGAAKGKNGFKLSLRGYDPEFDYRALLYDLSGRRFNRSDPARSLMLAKPTQQVAHGGGLRFDLGSRYYQTILNWISAGVPYGDPAKDRPAKVEVLPTEIFLSRPGLEQQILVLAHYPDGSTRDVTREAAVASNATSVADVGQASGLSIVPVKGLRKGEAAILVRFEGKFVTVPVTILDPRPGFAWTALPQNNYIDELLDAKLKRLKLQPSGPVSDAEFLRRASLDLIGLPPSPQEVRAFLAAPHRSAAIDRLMARSEFVDHWALKWGDLLQNSRKYVGDKGMWAFRDWIRRSVAANQPYDKMVRELLTSRGSTYENPAANYFRVARDPKAAMEKTTQLFLGVRMVCAQCHDHPFEQWTQNSYYELAAFFAAVGVKAGLDSDEEVVFEKREEAVVKHPKDNRVMPPRFLIASLDAPPIPATGDARESLVVWLTSPKNPFFARAISNRLWSYFFGRGIIDPVDDVRASNPPANEPLLNALAQDLTAHSYDLQHLIRTIVNSRAYQASISTNTWNADDEANFSHQAPRRLSAEELLDAVTVATGSRPNFPEVPPDFRAEQLPGPHVGVGGFLDLFGRPQRESSCECERRSDLSLPQTLNLINGPALADAIADPKGRVSQWVLAGLPDRKLIEELYLAALSRLPEAGEIDQALTYLQKGPSRATRAQDLLWALLNSNAFLFNR